MKLNNLKQRSANQLLPTSRKLATYSATIGTLCVLPQLCPADVFQYVPLGGSVTIGEFDNAFPVDMNGDDINDFFLVWGLYGGYSGQSFFEINGGESNQVDAPAMVVDMVPAGGTIQSSNFDEMLYGVFSGFVDTRGYVAVKFGIDPNLNPPTHYGYLDVEVKSDPTQLILHGGAYESTANTPISTPVPEPGSLAALAFGGLAAVSRRRRRKVPTG